MNLGLLILVVTAFLIFFMNAIYWYTQLETYPLFAWVPEEGFVSFHKEYERRLPVTLYAPYTLLMVSNMLLFFFRPETVGFGWVIALFLLNAFVMVESLVFAAPVHYEMHREGKEDIAIRKLVKLNSFRLAAGTASSIIALYLLASTLAA